MIYRIAKINTAILLFTVLLFFSCSSQKVIRYTLRPIPRGANIVVMIDAENKIKNVILMQFMKKGFHVKAINASDFYSLKDIYDIRDFKKLSYKGRADKFLSLEKTFNNLFKLNIYNYELNKAELLGEMRTKWNVQYLVLLELNNWQETSWGRVIDLGTNEVIWVDNHPASYRDNLESVTAHFIKSMTRR